MPIPVIFQLYIDLYWPLSSLEWFENYYYYPISKFNRLWIPICESDYKCITRIFYNLKTLIHYHLLSLILALMLVLCLPSMWIHYSNYTAITWAWPPLGCNKQCTREASPLKYINKQDIYIYQCSNGNSCNKWLSLDRRNPE